MQRGDNVVGDYAEDIEQWIGRQRGDNQREKRSRNKLFRIIEDVCGKAVGRSEMAVRIPKDHASRRVGFLGIAVGAEGVQECRKYCSMCADGSDDTTRRRR